MRTAGVLMPISSLPSRYGIGSMGKEARDFVDFLEEGGQTLWQILPLNPTGFGDSPYASFSTYAGNPYFIDLEYLIEEQLLTRDECEFYHWGSDPHRVDYGVLYASRYTLLKCAYARFLEDIPEEYEKFCEEQAFWLEDYAMYMALKDANAGKAWWNWEEDIKFRKPEAVAKAKVVMKDAMGFYKMLQYLFYEQWWQLKYYANSHGILIIGDVPIYVSLDSADVWANPKEFQLDKNLAPTDVAGCPPDAFSEDGQLWGNPLYRWSAMKKEGYTWWTNRVRAMSEIYDIVRLDHFRGFESYYAIPYGDKTAKNGKWVKGPGMHFFRHLENTLGTLPIIVEDLGLLTDAVKELLRDSGCPGMKVLQFAFDGDDGDYLPHNHIRHCVVYTGTHDNDTTMGWLNSCSEATLKRVKEYLNLTEEEGYNWGVMRAAWSSVANIAIVPMMDLLGLGSEARLNAPSTTGSNWQWRATEDQINSHLAKKLYQKMKLYSRLPKEEEEEEED